MHNDTQDLPQIKTGIYRHYKGNLYQILHTARHSESEEWFVVYRALYGDYGVWVRPLAMFTKTVEINSKDIPRFDLIQEL